MQDTKKEEDYEYLLKGKAKSSSIGWKKKSRRAEFRKKSKEILMNQNLGYLVKKPNIKQLPIY